MHIAYSYGPWAQQAGHARYNIFVIELVTQICQL